MQKNLLLAVVLSSLVYIGWYSYLDKKNAPMRAKMQAEQQAARARASGQAAPAGTQPAASAAPLAAQATSAPAAAPKNWKDSAVALKLGRSEYFFYPEAASIRGITFQGPISEVELVPDAGAGFFASSLPAAFKLSRRTDDSAEFTAAGPDGLSVTKKFTFGGEEALGTVSVTVENKGTRPLTVPAWEMTLGPGLGTVDSEQKENPDVWRAAYAFQEKDRKHPTVEELEDSRAENAPVWAGVDNRYFLAALAGGDLASTRPAGRTEKVNDKKAPLFAVPFDAAVLNPGQKQAWQASFYIGPKDYALLRRLGMGLDRSVDFGFFSPLAKLANSALGFFHGITGNYGVAIIILSVLLQLLITPLSMKSYKAMAVMKKIQPEMQSIQKRYKDNPQRMNAEIMELYKRHGTNPLGGCLPMLLQMPIFFALYTALRNSWNLHGAHFVFWIKDLSAKDPYYVLPLVMGGIMFLQQHMSPQTSDPAQAAMMKWMPVIFTFMFLTFPSGLVMYWLINSIWGFAQNMYLQKKMA